MSLGYHPDEAASYDRLMYRYNQAKDLFLGAFDQESGDLVGYVVSTLSDTPLLTEESIRVHNPKGKNVCIHSVCIAKDERRQGIALSLLSHYIDGLKAHNAMLAKEGRPPMYERATLISRENLVPLYVKAGFENLGKSTVVHGKAMRCDSAVFALARYSLCYLFTDGNYICITSW